MKHRLRWHNLARLLFDTKTEVGERADYASAFTSSALVRQHSSCRRCTPRRPARPTTTPTSPSSTRACHPTFTDEGMRAALEAHQAQPGLAVLALSQFVENEYAREFFAGDATGLGSLLKDRVADVREFVEAVQRAGAAARCSTGPRHSSSAATAATPHSTC